MTPPFHKTSAHLLLCTGSACCRLGSRELFSELWSAMEHERLSYYRTGGSVRLTESGCLGACGHGPTLVCYRDHEQAWYAPVSTTEALEIARSAHADDALPTKNRFDG